eukprot:CAMPEP_0204207172 /NCGR_PEP_ID=MMETSP0361-20130328/71579_1 /ASSEMBLY_ACC=CAM_ASM_000343 /TAXON_ID=268821 /ORGANISM="Scrippsiella Hangoei, Strain SHTV-5" /LENGTH=37 /DNA_ID= /DNA_START= /DNA_END= /DNA_ORIENTATION=
MRLNLLLLFWRGGALAEGLAPRRSVWDSAHPKHSRRA